jgi:hypothetical protein
MSGNNTAIFEITSDIAEFFSVMTVLLAKFIHIEHLIEDHPNANLLISGERALLLHNKLTHAWKQYNKIICHKDKDAYDLIRHLHKKVKEINSVISLAQVTYRPITKNTSIIKIRLKIRFIHQLQKLVGEVPDFESIEKEVMDYMDSLARMTRTP